MDGDEDSYGRLRTRIEIALENDRVIVEIGTSFRSEASPWDAI